MRARWLVLAAAAVIATIVLGASLREARALCPAGENQGCLEDARPERWEARVFNGDGRPMSGRARFSFGSQPEGEGPVEVAADRDGRVCVRWPADVAAGSIKVIPGTPRGRPDRRMVEELGMFGGLPRPRAMVLVNAFGNGGHLEGRGGTDVTQMPRWTAADRRPDCADAGTEPPWHRIQGADRNWRVWLTLILPAATLLLVAAAVGLRRLRGAARMPWLALATAAASIPAFLAVWGPLLGDGP
jgi:hypothetical protein